MINTLGIVLAALLAAPSLWAETSAVERMVRMHTESDDFFFFEDDRKKVADFKTDRLVRVCSGDSRHLVPLKITYDEKTVELHPNDCIRVEAKEIHLEPAQELDDNWVIQAEVDTLN